MLAYNLKLGLINLKRNPLLFVLVILTLSIGSGLLAANLAIYYSMAGDPYPHKSDKMYHVSLNTWPNLRAHIEPFYILRYSDTRHILASDIPTHTAISYQSGAYTRDAKSESLERQLAEIRATTPGFFDLFEAPFAYGQGFDSASSTDVVISHELNQNLFGGDNSVGEHIEIEGNEYRIVGVLAEWDLRPRIYHVTEDGAYSDTDDIFLPLETAIDNNFSIWARSSSTDGWNEVSQTREINAYYLQAWVQLDSQQQRKDFQAYLDSYTQELKDAGQHPLDIINEVNAMDNWLEKQAVVDQRVLAFALASGLFLLVCAFNASSLLLSKIHSMQFENSLRRAVGANQWQITAQGLIEGLIIGLISCAGALLLSGLFLQISTRLLPRIENLAVIDGKVLLSLMAITFGISLLSVLYPALRASQISLSSELK